ncbi:hypothetical protein QFC20_006865 [Naganishia adeliensis]|uniref:Uncharacterized protein n=1 Tax=Naganishia adeliensis TaxID=92952 RepID=A0ACC2V690_9TREE|nr:hypothetical protein QFC20_006865 [Naganishia adeliensis]
MSSLTYTPTRRAELVENLREVETSIAAAYASAPHDTRNPSPPRLVAVSKLKPASDILALYDAGHRHFGENYPQELSEKAAILPKDIVWHFIGTLQSNKAKGLVEEVGGGLVVETVGGGKVAGLLEKAMAKRVEGNAGKEGRLNVFIQVNTSHESVKSGVDPLPTASDTTDLANHELVKLATSIISSPHLNLQGLMTIGSLSSSTSASPNPDFSILSETRNQLFRYLSSEEGKTHLGPAAAQRIPEKEEHWELSMGMSSDYEQAIRQGSSSVRVGTKIFGERPKKVEVGGVKK